MKLYWLLLLAPFPVQALTSAQVLKTAWEDKTYLSYDEIRKTNSNNPFRNVEAFASSENNGKSEVEVGLKFQLKSWPEWRQKRSLGAEQKVLKESSLAWALKNRYNTLLLYELNRRKLESMKEILRLSDHFSQAQTLALHAGKVTAKSYSNAKADLLKYQRMQSALEQEREVLRRRIQIWVPDWKSGVLDEIDLLEIEDISQALKEQHSEMGSLTRKIAEEEIAQMSQELAIVKGREQQWLKGFEISHIKKDDDSLYEVQVNLQLPFLGSDDLAKQKQNELILKRALKQRDLEETGTQLESLRVQILNLIELYKSSRKQGQRKTAVLDPLVNLEVKLVGQQEELDLLNQRQEISALYLEYLLESEALIQHPEKNYLERTQKVLL